MQRRAHTGRAHYKPANTGASQISEGRLPPEDVSVWLENLWTCFSDDIAKILFPGFVWMRWDFSKKPSQISEGRLPPEDVSGWLENL